MHKALIIIFLLSLNSCAMRRMAVNTGENKETSAEEIIGRVVSNNISNDDYFIEKANISININGRNQKFLFTCKFKKPGDFLFSIKSVSGTEGARILITKDTLLINDRIGRRVIYGEPGDIENYSGFSYTLLGSLTGDYIDYVSEQKTNIENTVTAFKTIQRFNGRWLISEVDRRVFKIKYVAIRSTLSEGVADRDSVMISFSKFSKGEKVFPKSIEVRNFRRNISAVIRLERIQVPWEGELEFVAGKGYKIERIK